MHTDAPSAPATNTATPRHAETIAANRAHAEEKRRAAGNSGTTALAPLHRQTGTQLQLLANRTKQLNITPPPPVSVVAHSMSLISPSQLIPDDQMRDIDAVSTVQNLPPSAPSVIASSAPMAAAAAATSAAQLAAMPAMDSPLPPEFLAMKQTKEHQASAIALYRSEQQQLTAARDDLASFVADAGKRGSSILPVSLRASFSKARFIAVEGDAAFYKPMIDALKKLEEESAKSAFDLIVKGKEKYVAHLASLVETENFVTRAVARYSAFITSINKLYADSGTKIAVPLAAAITHFDTKLRKEMGAFVRQHVEGILEAQSKKKDEAAAEREAEEKIVEGSHNGANIAQIASKAAKTELIATKKDLISAQTQIASLQERVNLLSGATSAQPSKVPVTATPTSTPALKPNANKRKAIVLKPRRVEPNVDAMSDITVAAAASSKPSNSRGGGRPQKHPSKKTKRNHVAPAGSVGRPSRSE